MLLAVFFKFSVNIQEPKPLYSNLKELQQEILYVDASFYYESAGTDHCYFSNTKDSRDCHIFDHKFLK